jgi:ParB/RepB/Spo0J family partition protein
VLKPIKDLVVSKENPRKTKASEAQHAALVASIRAHGLIQPLVVRRTADNDNVFEVIDGGRRFAAIKEVGLEQVEVIVNESDFGIGELGTAANMMRAAMHPLDEAAVISRALADGESAEGIALRFGQTETWAHQRVKLDGLSPNAKKMFRDGMFGIGSAQALTLTDRAGQDAYLKKAKEPWMLEADAIRRNLLNQKIPASSALFDLADYPEEHISRDLFSEDVWLLNVEKFDALQEAAIGKLVEKLTAEGWSDVLVLMNGYDHTIMNKYAKVEGRVTKADRGKYVSMVISDPRSRAVSCDRGYVLRKSAGKIKLGKETGEDVAEAESVKALTCYDLNDSQKTIVGALLTNGVEAAIHLGDNYLALKALIGPLLDSDNKTPWAGGRRQMPNYLNVNTMLTQKVEGYSADGDVRFPTAETFEKMAWEEVMVLVREAALRCLNVLPVPDDATIKCLKKREIGWFRFDEGFLKRYRLDALRDLAKKLKVEHDDDTKKKDLIAAILEKDSGSTFIPL